MPMRSVKQRSYLWAKHPKIAEEFESATPAGADLPEYAGDSDKTSKKSALESMEKSPTYAALTKKKKKPGC